MIDNGDICNSANLGIYSANKTHSLTLHEMISPKKADTSLNWTIPHYTAHPLNTHIGCWQSKQHVGLTDTHLPFLCRKANISTVHPLTTINASLVMTSHMMMNKWGANLVFKEHQTINALIQMQMALAICPTSAYVNQTGTSQALV